MVSTSFISESSIDISLPVSTTADTTLDTNKNIELSLKSDGTVFIGQESLGVLNPKRIQSVLTAVAEKAESPIIVISADADVSHQAVVSVMDAARKAKLFRVTFKTQDNDSNFK
jgi:biopolymer transport protein ExbD